MPHPLPPGEGRGERARSHEQPRCHEAFRIAWAGSAARMEPRVSFLRGRGRSLGRDGLLGLVAPVAAGMPPEVEEATFTSPADATEQKTLLYVPPGSEPVPLLVAFHTWSGDYRQNESDYARWCIARGWSMVHPDLRGPANRSEAVGSDLAFADLAAHLELRPAGESSAGDRDACGTASGRTSWSPRYVERLSYPPDRGSRKTITAPLTRSITQ